MPTFTSTETNNTLYINDVGAGLNIPGPRGLQGPAGAAGAAGPTGPAGPTGSGTGDMSKAEYGATTGKVNTALNAESLGGAAAANYALATQLAAKEAKTPPTPAGTVTAAMPTINLDNYVPDYTALNMAGLANFFSAVKANHGSVAYIPPKPYRTMGGLEIPKYARVICDGRFLMETGNTHAFKILSNTTDPNPSVKDVKISDLKVDGNGNVGVTALLVQGTGIIQPTQTSPITSMHDVIIENFFADNCDVGIGAIPIAGSIDTQFEHFKFIFPVFRFCNNGFKLNSVNGSFHFDTPNFYLGANQVCFNLLRAGTVNINNHIAEGAQSGTGYAGASDGSTFLKTSEQFNHISIVGGQDENIENFYTNALNDYYPGAINVMGTLIQSKIKFTANVSFISYWNTIVSGAAGAFSDVVTTIPGTPPIVRTPAVNIYSNLDYFQNRSAVDGHDLGTKVGGTFAGASKFITRRDRDGGVSSSAMYHETHVNPLLQYSSEHTNRATSFANKKRPAESFMPPISDANFPLFEAIEPNGHGIMFYRNATDGGIEIVTTQGIVRIDGKKLVFNANGTVTWV